MVGSLEKHLVARTWEDPWKAPGSPGLRLLKGKQLLLCRDHMHTPGSICAPALSLRASLEFSGSIHGPW